MDCIECGQYDALDDDGLCTDCWHRALEEASAELDMDMRKDG